MASNVPTSAPSYTQLIDDVDWILSLHVNRLGDDVAALANLIGMFGKAQSWGTDLVGAAKNAKAPICVKASASSITVKPGVVWIANSGQTVRLPRRNTADVTLTASDLDTGAMAVGYYYIYAVADSAATTFTCKFSASASAPTGLTNFELIGWFYNQTSSVLDITLPYVGNVKGGNRDVPNAIYNSATADITLNDTSYGTDLDLITGLFYTSGRPVEIIANLGLETLAANPGLVDFLINVDGTDKTASEMHIKVTASADDLASPTLMYMEALSAGTHTIKVQGKVAQNSIRVTNWGISIKEL